MIVAVQDELAARPPDHRLEGGGIGQALEARFRGERRMVDQHDAAQPSRAEIGQQALGLAICAAPRCRWRDSGGLGTPLDRPTRAHGRAPAQVGKTSKSSPAAGRRRRYRRPTGRGSGQAVGDIDVVVAGDDRDRVGPPSVASQSAARRELRAAARCSPDRR
jgi:hypothetical protein